MTMFGGFNADDFYDRIYGAYGQFQNKLPFGQPRPMFPVGLAGGGISTYGEPITQATPQAPYVGPQPEEEAMMGPTVQAQAAGPPREPGGDGEPGGQPGPGQPGYDYGIGYSQNPLDRVSYNRARSVAGAPGYIAAKLGAPGGWMGAVSGMGPAENRITRGLTAIGVTPENYPDIWKDRTPLEVSKLSWVERLFEDQAVDEDPGAHYGEPAPPGDPGAYRSPSAWGDRLAGKTNEDLVGRWGAMGSSQLPHDITKQVRDLYGQVEDYMTPTPAPMKMRTEPEDITGLAGGGEGDREAAAREELERELERDLEDTIDAMGGRDREESDPWGGGREDGFQHGGLVTPGRLDKAGKARLHPGEVVLPIETVHSFGGPAALKQMVASTTPQWDFTGLDEFMKGTGT